MTFSLDQIPRKNMKAHPTRTIILMVLTAVQVMSILTGLFLVSAMRQELQLVQLRLGADLLVYPTQAMSKISKDALLMQGTPVLVYKSRSMLSRLTDNENIAAVSYQIYISDKTAEGETIFITGYDPDTDFVIAPWIAEGQSFKPEDETVIVGSKVKTSADNTISLFQKERLVSGHLLETGSELDEMAFVNLNTLNSLIKDSAEAGIQTFAKVDPCNVWSSALIRVNDKQNVESVTNWINIYVRKVDAIRSENTLIATASGIQSQIKSIAVIALSTWAVLLLAMGIVQSMLMRERKKELYIWYMIGASGAKVENIILREAVLTHFYGAAFGVILTCVLFPVFGKTILQGITDPRINMIPAAVIALVLSLLAGCLSTRMAVRHVSRSMRGQILLSV